MKRTSQFIVKAAVIGTIYALLTLILSPFSYGVMQVRFSEALCVLALYTPAAIPGLTIGCFFANFIGANGIIDAIVGSLATLIGSAGIYALRRYKYASLAANVLSNAVLVGLMLKKWFGVPFSAITCILWVGMGELLSCYALGIPLIKYLDKHSHDLGL